MHPQNAPRPGDEPGRAVRVKPQGPKVAPGGAVPFVTPRPPDPAARRLALRLRHHLQTA